MQYFTTQLRNEQDRSRSLRASQYKKERKTKPDQEEEEEEEEKEEQNASAQVKKITRARSKAEPYASVVSPELGQLRVAGLLPEEKDDVPPAPFPHAPAKTSTDRYRPAEVQEELAKLPSRLYDVKAAPKRNPPPGAYDDRLKMHHMQVISTLLHRCLLEGDYQRAGRAWGLLLRTHVTDGETVDPRNHGRWGIGAEILLRRKPRTQNEQLEDEPRSTGANAFSDEGFETAREYYERLIVQHPNRKLFPHSIDDRTFYPAMFSLWIYEVCERSKRAKGKLQDDGARQSRFSRSMSTDSVLGEKPNTSHAADNEIQVEELARAMEIAERLDQLVNSPPFDKQASLLQLRGHVGLWISDLTIGKTGLDSDWDTDSTGENGNVDSDSTAEQLTQLTNAHRELQEAQNFFRRAAVNGVQEQAATVSSIDIKLRELARQLKKVFAPPPATRQHAALSHEQSRPFAL
ncbi:hypothetical protein EJ02DRAFT_242152 [Clathrospora elynae]|uniref:Uncharacterized protein n=1 Tax=Clathrospora elynae TaxID=706981 RepID=A0A6A5SJG7_9PLEO|nr:hypothetical protein EJ02DRAFT_242152 [Clathrospora elynae]